MDISTIIGISFSLILAGLAVGLGTRLLQLRRASSQVAGDNDSVQPSKREDDERCQGDDQKALRNALHHEFEDQHRRLSRAQSEKKRSRPGETGS